MKKNVDLKFVKKSFNDDNGNVIEYERLSLELDGITFELKVDKKDLSLLKYILKGGN